MTEENIDIPDRITQRLEKTTDEIDDLLRQIKEIQKTSLTQIQFRFHQCADKPLLSSYEQAQSVCFVTRFESLPVLDGVAVLQEEDGTYYFENISSMRHVLNEFRPIIVNQSDSVYYHNIHNFVRQKLINIDPSKDLEISIYDGQENNVTEIFTRILDERVKSIRILLENSDFKYIYNGILQHSAHEHTDRFWNDYYSGELNYIYFKHALLLRPIKEMLYWHYKVINCLTFPKLGGL